MRRWTTILAALALAATPLFAVGFAGTAHAQPPALGNGQLGAWVPASTFTVTVNYCGTPPGTVSSPPCAPNTSQSYTLSLASIYTSGPTACTDTFTATGTTVGNPAQNWTMNGTIGPYSAASPSLFSFTSTGNGDGATGFVLTTDNDNDAASDPEATTDGDELTINNDGSSSGYAYNGTQPPGSAQVYWVIFPAGSFVAGPVCQIASQTPTQGSQIGSCTSSYTVPLATSPYVISACSPVWPGGGINAAGSNSVGVHWTGTRGSYAHFPCAVPSIVTGNEFATYNSSELDVATTSQDGYNNIQEWCQVQTSDRPGSNLYATLGGANGSLPDSLCYNQSQNPPYDSTAGNDMFTVTENATGLVTLRCTFRTYNN